ncbi:OLC1v1000678C1 [Oldenlandia corymbosa var. corymbosa]|uniref:OLC1v1000678C1 n=1 Tax=Oldenlandia corymbosa var. corymbosa TaxID=529605 RepID=A0AAV1D496_OLDCO|nr:OLC1v1000678C1 [Oldenlandia corymbosa var. corymbosa]
MINGHGTSSSSETRRKGCSSSGKRGSGNTAIDVPSSENVGGGEGSGNNSGHTPGQAATTAPCGACKFLRRKCISGCIFAPHFGSDQGAARFAAVHKVFGASNVSKLLLHIPEHRRNDAVVTISYEAQARLSDPVYGCVSTILALQQQVASLQAELSMVQTQLINSRYAMANAIQDSQAIQHQQIAVALQPAYSNTSSASNNLMNINSCNTTSNFDLGSGGDVVAPPCYSTFDPVHLTGAAAGRAPREVVEEDDEEESRHHNPLDQFTNQIFQHHPDSKTYF